MWGISLQGGESGFCSWKLQHCKARERHSIRSLAFPMVLLATFLLGGNGATAVIKNFCHMLCS